MVNPLTSCPSGVTQPIVTQEQKGLLMHYPVQFAHIDYEINQIILTSPDPQTLLTKMARTLAEQFQVDCCCIATVAHPAVPTVSPQIALWRGDQAPALLPGYAGQWGHHPLLTINADHQQPLAIPDLQVLEWEGVADLLPVRAVLKIQTWYQSVINGVILLGRSQPHEWTNWETDRLSRAAQSVAVGISQVQLTQQVGVVTRHQKELNQLKEDFISTMNHELRTPLTAMSLAIRMLRQPKLPAKRREKYLAILEEQCNQEIELINDLLSLQQLESNSSQIQAQALNIMALIHKLGRTFEEKWVEKGLTVQVDTTVPALIMRTDPDSLERILLELLTNAGKYSDPQTTIGLKVTHQIQDPIHQVVLTLTNIGTAISPTDIDHIFEKFRRGQGMTEQAVPGTGLGLALVKCLVEQLNGTIEVCSRPLAHSSSAAISFTLTLPQFYH